MTRYISRILRLAYIIEQAHGASFSQAVIVLGKYEVHDIIAKLPMGSSEITWFILMYSPYLFAYKFINGGNLHHFPLKPEFKNTICKIYSFPLYGDNLFSYQTFLDTINIRFAA